MNPYGALVSLRSKLYAAGVLSSSRVDVPVISVGNLTWGGTGKTPVTAWIAAHFHSAGRRVGILSRGYGRASRGTVVVSDGNRILVSAADSGDEPQQLALTLPDSIVVVAARRIDAARRARELGANLLILDDGFQHLAIERDLNIVLLDALNPFGGGLPPAGRLREPASALVRADVVLITRADADGSTPALDARVRQLNTRAPIFHLRFRFSGWRDEKGRRVEAVEGASIAVCGIASPESFRQTLREARVEPAELIVFRDHHDYAPGDIRNLEERAASRGARLLVTTEKDTVKLAGRTRLKLLAARIEPEPREGELLETLDSMLEGRLHGS